MLENLKNILKISAVFPYENQSFKWKLFRVSTSLILFFVLTTFAVAAVTFSIKYQSTVEMVKASGYTYNVVVIDVMIYIYYLWNRATLKRTIDAWEEIIQQSKIFFLSNILSSDEEFIFRNP